MPLPVGTVVQVDYDLLVDGKLLETTDEARSREHSLHQEGRVYRPFQFISGIGSIIAGLEEHVQETVTRPLEGRVEHATIPPEKAYGLRDPKNIQYVPTAQLRGQEVRVGTHLQFGNRTGVVMRIAGGRIVVDLNHDLAGKTLVYDYIVRSVLTDPKQKATAIIERLLGPDATHRWTEDDTVLTVDAPSAISLSPQWQEVRFMLVRQLRLVLGEVEPLIRLVEYFDPTPKPGPTPAATEPMVPPAPTPTEPVAEPPATS